jgi:chemotaxis protein MotB
MARKKKHEEHVNAEAWAIPYGDLVTLLFALFTVMYAVSSVNEGKFRVLSDSMIAAFRGAPKSVKPINLGEKESGKGGEKPLVGVTPTVLLKIKSPIPGIARDPNAAAGESSSAGGKDAADTGAGVLVRMEHEVQDALQGLIDAKMVTIKRENLWLEVEINTDILFPSGSGGFSPEAQPVLDKLAAVLRPFPNPIRVEGHTDDRPIRTAAFPSNWELSAARAASVVHQFMQAGIDPSRLEIVGFGEFRPLQPNDSVVGRNANRRVSILILEQTAPNDAVTARARDITVNSALNSQGAFDGTAADAPGAENRVIVQVPADELEKTVLIKAKGKTP